jgi:hypothetical protein
MWKPEHVKKFLENVAVRHGEKRAKASITLSIQAERDPSKLDYLLEMWDKLLVGIKRDRDRLVDDAKTNLAIRVPAGGG